MQARSKKYLYDIAQAAGAALDFIGGKSFTDYNADILLRSAVERQLEIVGEALAQLSRTDPATASLISDHRRIIAFRNILIHGYAEIDQQIMWDVLEIKLPALRREVESLLRLDEGGGDART
jgi:uncharacterized protein with HEPN domain